MRRHLGCLTVCAAAVALLGSAGAGATPYWVDYEASSGLLPEDTGQGWQRVWGDWQGQYHGSGANRTIENGTLTYDSLSDAGIYDFSEIDRPGQIDPGPGEVFLMEWRLKVDQVVGRADPAVVVSSDDAWVLGLEFGYGRIYSVFENYLVIPSSPGVFHDYRVASSDMRTYDLYIDGALAREGAFVHSVGPSQVGWGDSIQGAASVHSWDYCRFGVLPEPSSLLALGLLSACCGRRRAWCRHLSSEK